MERLRAMAEAAREQNGLTQRMGMELLLDEQGPHCRMEVTDALCGAPGICHGGAIAALLDSALGGVALVHALELDRLTSTVEIKVNFLRPAPVGTVLTARPRLIHGGRSLVVAEGTAFDQHGNKVAHAMGTFNLFNPARSSLDAG